MKRPKPLPAVDRNGARRACSPSGSHVRPSDFQDFFKRQWADTGIVAYL